jgi:hypothetical protein
MKIKEINASSRPDLKFKSKIFEQAEASLKRLNANFIFEVSNKVQKLKSLEESIQRISTESYSADKLEKKFGYDYDYLMTLQESFQTQESKDIYKSLVEEALVLAGNIYKETNVTPRLISYAINEDLSEMENNIIYENALTHSLEKNFRIPLLQGSLLQESEDEVKTIIKKSVDKGVTDLGEINPSEMATYLPFQNTVKDHISTIIIPDGSMSKINDFNDAQDGTYLSIEGNAPAVLSKLDKILDKISTMVGPALFKEKVDMGEDSFDGTKYAMMKAVSDMSPASDDESGSCAMVATVDTASPETSDDILDKNGDVIVDIAKDIDKEDDSDIEAEAAAIDDALEKDLDNDDTPDIDEPHGDDSDGDGNPVDSDDIYKTHGEITKAKG